MNVRRLSLALLVSALALAGCARPPESVSAARRLCAMLVSCPGLAQQVGMGNNGGQCVANAITLLAAVAGSPEQRFTIDCARNATSCDTLRSCLARNHGPDYCMANPGASCDGNVLVRCPDMPPAMGTPAGEWPLINSTDCATSVNGACIAPGMGGAASCQSVNGCVPSATPPRCDGARAIVCNPDTMREVVSDCAAQFQGGTCAMVGADPATAVPQCVPSATTCMVDPRAADRDARCEQNTLVRCRPLGAGMPGPDGLVEGREERIDCASELFEARCGAVGGRAACIPVANACAPGSPDRCSGGTLEVCVNGRYDGTDCASFGLSRCTQRSLTLAVCAN